MKHEQKHTRTLYFKNKAKLLIIIILVFVSGKSFSQKFTISGYISDLKTGEKLIGAAIYDNLNKRNGTITNQYGFFSLTIPQAEIELTAAYIGYMPKISKFKLEKDTTINFELSSDNEIEEITVTGERSELEDTQMSKENVSVTTIQSMPVLLGETDVLKAIQLLPGVQSGSEGTSGIYVRGGGPDQNLILLDGVPVYNVNHLFGFFSVFNADAINDISLIKGGFPAHYGGRLSCVLDISMKEGNTKKVSGSASVGIISSKFTIEGPIKEKTSFIISGRRTYIDVLAAPLIALASKQNDFSKFRAGYFFYDLNAKINHKFSDKDRLYLSAYTGRDKAYTIAEETRQDMTNKSEFDLHWGNITTALRWNHLINPRLFCNTTLTYSRYNFVTSVSESQKQTNSSDRYAFSLDYISGIEDFGGKVDFDYRPLPGHEIKFGANLTNHTFKPGVVAQYFTDESTGENIDLTFGNDNINSNEFALYFEDEIRISGKIKANAGLHFSGIQVQNSFYNSLQPRISVRYLASKKVSIKAAYSEMAQYLHLLANSAIGMPTDLWLPVTDNVKPQKSKQAATGMVYSINETYNISLEAYYKTMTNLIEYKEGTSFFDNINLDNQSGGNAWERNIETNGKGWSYGLELMFKKQIGKTTGWIAYTLSKSDRQFAGVSFGEKFPYKYDRRNDASIVLNHKFSDYVDVGLVWVYGTGNAVSLALEKYASMQGNNYWDGSGSNTQGTVEYYESRNNFRMPSYHRLDLNVNLHKTKKHGKQTWSFGLYNAYNRKNPFFLMFGYDYSTDKRVLKQYSLFPIIPSVSYRFDF